MDPQMRHYLPRAFGLLESGVLVQGTAYQAGQGQLNADGTYGETPYEGLSGLAAVAGWDQSTTQAFVARLQVILAK